MRVIVMRIQISQTFFIALQILVNFFHSLQSFFFLKKLKKSRAEQIYIDKKSENFRPLFKARFSSPKSPCSFHYQICVGNEH